MAQLVRAPPCHGGGRGFESHSGRLTDYSVFGIIAQLGEHLPYKQRVIGSSPIGPIDMDGFPSGQRGQTVNLLATPSKVRILLHPLANMACADVAQLAEQLICNQQVIGSSPIIGFIMKMIELNIIAGWSSLEARRAHNPKVVGSNPAPAILPR